MSHHNFTLHYFNNKGRAEITRWMFALAHVKYEDKRYSDDEWILFKPLTPFNQIPVLEVDGTLLCQSGAMVVYVAREYGFMGSSNLEAAEIDMMVGCMEDTNRVVTDSVWYYKSPEEQVALEKQFEEVSLPKFLTFLCSRLKGRNFLVGNKISLADVASVCFLESLPTKFSSIPNHYPEVASLIQRVTRTPEIAEWLVRRPITPF